MGLMSVGPVPANHRITHHLFDIHRLSRMQQEPPLILSEDMDLDIVQEFLNDGREHLEAIEQQVLSLESDPSDTDALNTLFRAFHSLKGNAGFIDLTPIAELAHALESLLDAARDGRLEVSAEVADLILAGRDTLSECVDKVEGQMLGQEDVRIARITSN